MATCPECDAEIEVDEFDVDKGDQLSCPECGSNLEVVGLSPIELDIAPDDDEDDDDEVGDEEELEDADEDEDEDEDDGAPGATADPAGGRAGAPPAACSERIIASCICISCISSWR